MIRRMVRGVAEYLYIPEDAEYEGEYEEIEGEYEAGEYEEGEYE